MKQWWQSLNQREQLMVGGGSIFAFIIIFYFFLWHPLTKNIAHTKSYVNYQRGILTWMDQKQPILKQLKNNGALMTKTTSSALLITVDTALSQQRLKPFLASIQQTSNNKVLVKFNQVPFDNLIKWIASLWQTHAIKVDDISIKPIKHIKGTVSATIFLTS